METNLWLKHVSRDRRPPHSAAGLPAPAGATSALPAPTPQGNTAAPGRRRRETGGARTGTRGPGPRRSPHPQCRTGSVAAPLRLARGARRRFWPFLPLTSGRQPRCRPAALLCQQLRLPQRVPAGPPAGGSCAAQGQSWQLQPQPSYT